MLVAGFLGAGSVYALTSPDVSKTVVSVVGSPECRIKGNVSIESGKRIYHVPGQRHYAETIIRPEYGERWFCSEADARAAGWRKSGV
jgi:hypothetical protein